MTYAASHPSFITLLLLAGLLLGALGCDSAAPTDPMDPTPPPVTPPPVDPPPVDPPEEEVAVGAAYPNAADGRIILINAEGDRFVYWNPTNGSFSSARPVSDLENGALPFSRLGASVSTLDKAETYFFDTDGESYVVYERDEAEFDETEDFGEDDADLADADIEEVGAALVVSPIGSVNPDRIFLFNGQGTRYQVWDYVEESWSDVARFPTDFGGGGAPIAAVGAAVYVESDGAFYMFNRDGTEYTIYTGTFSDDFDIDELGDGTLSFD
ncbi:MAG: hypothetical protein AAGF99_11115 [Bacteroidota bacterium]